jgi:hypothetical protein
MRGILTTIGSKLFVKNSETEQNKIKVFDSGIIRHYPESFGYKRKVSQYKSRTDGGYKLYKTLDKEDSFSRSNSNATFTTNLVTSNQNIEPKYSNKTSPYKKSSLSHKAKFRHLIPKKIRSKQDVPLPFIYERSNNIK